MVFVRGIVLGDFLVMDNLEMDITACWDARVMDCNFMAYHGTCEQKTLVITHTHDSEAMYDSDCLT